MWIFEKIFFKNQRGLENIKNSGNNKEDGWNRIYR